MTASFLSQCCCFIAISPCQNSLGTPSAQAKVWAKFWPIFKAVTKSRIYFKLKYLCSCYFQFCFYLFFLFINLGLSLWRRRKSQKRPNTPASYCGIQMKPGYLLCRLKSRTGHFTKLYLSFVYGHLSTLGFDNKSKVPLFYCHLPVSTDAGKKKIKDPVLVNGRGSCCYWGKQIAWRIGNWSQTGRKRNTDLLSSVHEVSSQWKTWDYAHYILKGQKNSSWFTFFQIKMSQQTIMDVLWETG